MAALASGLDVLRVPRTGSRRDSRRLGKKPRGVPNERRAPGTNSPGQLESDLKSPDSVEETRVER